MFNLNQEPKNSNNELKTITETQPKIRVYQLSLQWTNSNPHQLNLILQT